MLFLSADSSLDAPLVPNSFLIFRLVCFALLSNLAFLQLIFASWNINASLSMTLSAPSTSIFIIFESCILFFSLAFALADFVWARGRNLLIFLECSWVGIVSLLEIGTAIGTTITGPGMACDISLGWSVCASSWLLIPSTWLSSILFLAYFLTLFMTTMAHKDLYSDIWRRTVYGVVWFGRSHEISFKGNVKNIEDIENSSAQKQLHPVSESVKNASVEKTPPKATNSVRRGIDAPFSRRQSRSCSNSSSLAISTLTLPSSPDKSAKSEGSRFIETFREPTLLARPESSEHFVADYQIAQDPLPSLVIDVDAPIPLPRLSEWVRADVLNGTSVHTNPHTSVALQTKNTT